MVAYQIFSGPFTPNWVNQRWEHTLCNTYAQVLDLDNKEIGTTRDFFNLGGNSLLAMKLVSLINTNLKQSIKLSDLYSLSSASIKSLSTIINVHTISESSNEIEGTL